MTKRNTAVSNPWTRLLNKRDNKNMGCNLQTSKDYRMLKWVSYQIETHWHTFLYIYLLAHFDLSTFCNLYLLAPQVSEKNDIHTHTHAYIHTCTRTHTHIHTQTHTHTHKRVMYEALVECYWESWQFLPLELAVKCISQIKWHQWHMSSLTD